jgi:hypothetical protein
VAAFYTDVDVTPCPLRVGSSTCGTSTQQWLAAHVQNQQNYAGTHTWDWIPRATVLTQTCFMTTSSLPNGIINAAYNQTLATTGCTGPAFSLLSGSLPVGLGINPITGTISGTPTNAGTSYFTVAISDANGNPCGAFFITINNVTSSSGTTISGRGNLTGNGTLH